MSRSCLSLLKKGSIPPVPNFAKIHAREARGLLRIAPRDLIPLPPVHASARRLCACVYRQRHPAQCTHSNEDIQQPTASLHTARQQPGNSSAPTAPGFGSHATRSLFFPTKARRFAHVWRIRALRCGRRATLQLSDTSQHSPKFAQILPDQTVPNLHSRFTLLSFALLPGQSGHTSAIT